MRRAIVDVMSASKLIDSPSQSCTNMTALIENRPQKSGVVWMDFPTPPGGLWNVGQQPMPRVKQTTITQIQQTNPEAALMQGDRRVVAGRPHRKQSCKLK